MKERTQLSTRELQALRHIRNRLFHGRSPSVRDLQQALGYRSPRSAALLIEKLLARGFLRRRPDGRLQLLRDALPAQDHAETVEVPLVGTAPCGSPVIAEENWEGTIPVSTRLASPAHRYFFVRANGESMSAAGIGDGDLVLVQQQPIAESGDRVVALIDGEVTIKELRRTNDALVLVPRSEDRSHRPIVVAGDFHIQGVVVAVVPAKEVQLSDEAA